MNSGKPVCLVSWLVFAAFLGGPSREAAASPAGSVLVPLSQEWRYDESGEDLGAAWKEVDYVDDAWSSGRALFGHSSKPYPEPFLTDLDIFPDGSTNRVITYYFRTHFNFSGDTNGLVLAAGTLINAGMVVYLNGTEAGRIRVQPGQDYLSVEDSHQFYQGYYELLTFPHDALVQGDNVLAAELHQTSTPTNTNVVFGLTLSAAMMQPVSISQQPAFAGGVQGLPTRFWIKASGTWAQYQWLKTECRCQAPPMPPGASFRRNQRMPASTPSRSATHWGA